MRFAWPLALIGLPVGLALLALGLRASGRRRPKVPLPDLCIRGAAVRRARRGALARALRFAAAAAVLTALAGPLGKPTPETLSSLGVDMALCLDLSASMSEVDYPPATRLDVAKSVLAQFVRMLRGDRAALIVFGAQAFTMVPLTYDHALLAELTEGLDFGIVDGDGTAIGMALAAAVARLEASDAKSKVIIILTDGVNNRGEVSPATAARLAADRGIRIYTIGVGLPGRVTIWGRSGYEVDEESLSEIASLTGGRFYRATDPGTLEAVYGEILSLERSRLASGEAARYLVALRPWLGAALAALALELVLAAAAPCAP